MSALDGSPLTGDPGSPEVLALVTAIRPVRPLGPPSAGRDLPAAPQADGLGLHGGEPVHAGVDRLAPHPCDA